MNREELLVAAAVADRYPPGHGSEWIAGRPIDPEQIARLLQADPALLNRC